MALGMALCWITSQNGTAPKLENNVHATSKQFGTAGVDRKSIVLSNYYTGFSGDQEDAVFERFQREARHFSFSEAIFIRKDGTLRRAET